MGTEPNGWQTPKTDWTTEDPVGNGDLNRIEGNIEAVELGNRTVDDAQAPSSDTGYLRQFLDWIVNRLKAITGETNWYDAPADTIKAIVQTITDLTLDDVSDGAIYKRIKDVNASHEIVNASVASDADIATQKLKANVSTLNEGRHIPANGGTWVPPKGFYMFQKALGSLGMFGLQLYDGSSWQTGYYAGASEPVHGCFYFDGTNQRIRNGSSNSLTLYYHKFD
jgi:hypothetical protein